MLMSLAHLMIGNIQGGAIDLVVFGVLGGLKTQWWYAVLLGVFYFLIYYAAFKFVIKRMNVETPGREPESAASPAPVSADERTQTIIDGLGGQSNIAEVDCCFTRLRVQVKDISLVVDNTLMTTGANGVKRINEHNVQVIYGPKVEKIAQDVKTALGVTA